MNKYSSFMDENVGRIMKGTFFLGSDSNRKFEVREMGDLGLLLGEHDVLVKNMAAGICGTDVHIYLGEKGSAEVTPPVVLGHEYSGVVEKIGASVQNVKVGDHVTVDPNIYCGKCRPCRMGHKQNCENLFALGVNVDGGFAEYSICPDTQCFKLNDDIPFDIGAMTEPLSCVLHGVDLADMKSGESVLIIGGGTIGLMMAQVMKISGADTVLVSEPVEKRREIALSLGIDYVIDPVNSDLSEEIRKMTGRDGVDKVVECVGSPSAARDAISSADTGGTILFFSVPKVDAKLELPLFDVYKKELKIVGSMINPDTYQRAVNLINSGRIRVEPLITHVYPKERLEDAIRMQMSSDSIKVVVHPND